MNSLWSVRERLRARWSSASSSWYLAYWLARCLVVPPCSGTCVSPSVAGTAARRSETSDVVRLQLQRRAPTTHTSLPQIGFVVLLAVWSSQALSQVDRSAYQPSTIDEIIAQHGLKVGSSEGAALETHLISPEFKYRLRVRATGRIRELTPVAVDAMSVWSRMVEGLPAFVKAYTHEVEIEADDRSTWLLWQRSLVASFRAERSNGGDIEVHAILAGTFHGKLLLFVTAFEAVA